MDALLLSSSLQNCYGRSFNLGHHEVVSLKEIAETLAELAPGLKVECIPWPEEKKRIDIGDYFADFSAFQEATNWTPKVGLREGLARMLAYYEINKDEYLPLPRRGLRILP